VLTKRLEPADETQAWVELRQLAARSGFQNRDEPVQSIPVTAPRGRLAFGQTLLMTGAEW
jgi:hypothetical protein